MTIARVICMAAWPVASLLIMALCAILQPALAAPALQPSAATSNSAESCSGEDNLEMRERRALLAYQDNKWANATIPYSISEKFNEEEVGTLLTAMEWWTNDTCLQFVQHSIESRYLYFVKSNHCSTYVGKQNQSGAQEVKLNSKCIRKTGSVAHEIGHALGFLHEHQRPDRDEFVEVLYNNIHPWYHFLFQKVPVEMLDSLHVGYDYGSIMHYDVFAYSLDPESKPSLNILKDYDGKVGQREKISDLDKEQINYFYGCQGSSSGVAQPPTSTLLIMPSSSLQSLTSSLLSPTNFPSPSWSLSSSSPLSSQSSNPPSHLTEEIIKHSNLPTSSPLQTPLPQDSHSSFSFSPYSSSQQVTSQSTTGFSPSTSSSLSSLQLTTKIGQSASPSPSLSSLQLTTKISLSASPSPSQSSQPNTKMQTIIAAGARFGMRIITETANDSPWMACNYGNKKKCRLNNCPSKHGLNIQQCQWSTYLLEKLHGSANISIITEGDLVALRPSTNSSIIIHCGDEDNQKNSVCKSSSNGCGMLGDFDMASCKYHIMEVRSHRDSNESSHQQVTLHFLDQDKTTWLGCNLQGKMYCKRFSCEDNQPCTPDRFELIEVL